MVVDPLQKIGEEIRNARTKRGMSIDKLAKESRVAAHHIESIESYERSKLPEEAYLSGFLIKLLRTLDLPDPEKRVENFKQEEGAFIVQDLVNNSSLEDSDMKSVDDAYFKLYHVYIIIGLLIFFVFWFLLVNSFADKKPQSQGGILGTPKKAKAKKLPAESIQELSPTLDKNGTPQVENLDTMVEKKIIPVSSLRRGQGSQELNLRVKDVAWVQIIGVRSKEILYEGDVFPDQGPNNLQLFDDTGFVVATGNAGAFEVTTFEGTQSLGREGERIKWYYPQSAKMVYKTKEFTVESKKKKRKKH